MCPEGVGPPRGARHAARRRGDLVLVLGAAVALLGMLVLVTGTFVPWLRSGSVLRDSYQSIGVLRVLVTQQAGAVGVLLTAWLAIIPVCSVSVALFAFRFRRTSAILACLVALFAGTIGGILGIQGAGPATMVGVVSTGPVMTSAGSVLVLIGAIAVVIGPRGRRAHTVGVTS